MNANRDLERRLTDLYSEEEPVRAPNRVLASALATIESTPQRRVLPWSFPNMTNYAGLAVSAVAVIAALAVVAVSFGLYSSRPPGPAASPSPMPASTAVPAASALRIPTVAATAAAGPSAAGTFERTGDLAIARSGHTAILLQDGRVLVIGGWIAFQRRVPASEIYDPRTGLFTQLDPILPAFNRGNEAQDENQAAFSATVLADGRVLLAGGRLGEDPDVPSTFGVPPPPPAADAVLFDPESGDTIQTGPMSVARAGHVAARLPDGRVLIVGGIGKDASGVEQSLASAEIYDPVTETFSPTGSMASDRTAFYAFDLAATELPSGRVIVSGGMHWEGNPDGTGGGRGVTEPDEIYDPTTGTFVPILSESPREVGTTLLLIRDHVYRYDFLTGTATDLTPQPADLVREFGDNCRELPADCRNDMTTSLLDDGRVLLAGGSQFEIAPLFRLGWRSGAQTSGEVLDPVSGVASATGPLVDVRVGHTATVLADGRVLLIGGYVPGTAQAPRFLSSAEIFTPR